MPAPPSDDRPTEDDAPTPSWPTADERPEAASGEGDEDGAPVSFTAGPVWTAVLRAMARVVDVMLVGLGAGSLLQLVIDPTEQTVIAGVALNLALLVYFVAGEMRFGASVGKRLFKLRVHAADSDDPPGFSAALLRNAIVVAGAAGGLFGLIIAVGLGVSIVMGRGRGFHDRVTKVVVEAKPR